MLTNLMRAEVLSFKPVFLIVAKLLQQLEASPGTNQ